MRARSFMNQDSHRDVLHFVWALPGLTILLL